MVTRRRVSAVCGERRSVAGERRDSEGESEGHLDFASLSLSPRARGEFE